MIETQPILQHVIEELKDDTRSIYEIVSELDLFFEQKED